MIGFSHLVTRSVAIGALRFTEAAAIEVRLIEENFDMSKSGYSTFELQR